MISRCSNHMESQSRTSRWLRLCTSVPETAESADPCRFDTDPRPHARIKGCVNRPDSIRSVDASRLRLPEALEVSTHGIEEDEHDGQGQVDQQRDGRAHEGDCDGHRSDDGPDREPDPHFVDERRIEARFDQTPISPDMYHQIRYPRVANKPRTPPYKLRAIGSFV